MSTLACLYHWYTSALFVVPVLAVGGWGWWSSKRLAKQAETPPLEGPASSAS
jgi:hypothetical protein